ncbi:MAG TPA: hypothetical protein PLG33_09380 [Prolixibacteraceae bacterium]|nr:hypothetical protein [Prolixibacteraceae bacterium]HPR86253.1 hypothetical protein [Prolixibacteraceae bacterium]
MQQTEALLNELLEAYSEANLNKITRNLIRLYKEKEFEKLNIMAGMLSEWVEISIDSEGKGFSKIISLYHPDRGEFYRTQIGELANSGQLQLLDKFRHIFVIQDIEEITITMDSLEDIDYQPEYEWDFKASEFHFRERKTRTQPPKKFKGYTFYEAMQIRQYGNTRKKFPTYYFEDMDEIELSESEISDLDGAEYCIHTLLMDLSENLITDLSPLSTLRQLQELNLSGNKLSYIDALGNLLQLRSVDLSNNTIDDISPLFEIPTLEYADLTGNRISQAQIQELHELGVTVDC